jgi:hypothetical protein
MVDFKNYFEKIHASKTEDENYIQENYDTIIQKNNIQLIRLNGYLMLIFNN